MGEMETMAYVKLCAENMGLERQLREAASTIQELREENERLKAGSYSAGRSGDQVSPPERSVP